jgi:hypothetical protein
MTQTTDMPYICNMMGRDIVCLLMQIHRLPETVSDEYVKSLVTKIAVLKRRWPIPKQIGRGSTGVHSSSNADFNVQYLSRALRETV